METITIPSPFDAHVHLRQGDLMKLVVPHVPRGGVKLAYVMVRSLPDLFLGRKAYLELPFSPTSSLPSLRPPNLSPTSPNSRLLLPPSTSSPPSTSPRLSLLP